MRMLCSVPARCHDLDLTTEVVSTGNPDLTRGEPTVFLNGSLILEVNSKQRGSALYRTVLKSKHSNEPFSSQPKVFSLIVQQPNLAPSGDALNVIVNSVTAYPIIGPPTVIDVNDEGLVSVASIK